jgi:hypothetical protein
MCISQFLAIVAQWLAICTARPSAASPSASSASAAPMCRIPLPVEVHDEGTVHLQASDPLVILGFASDLAWQRKAFLIRISAGQDFFIRGGRETMRNPEDS